MTISIWATATIMSMQALVMTPSRAMAATTFCWAAQETTPLLAAVAQTILKGALAPTNSMAENTPTPPMFMVTTREINGFLDIM